MIDRRGERALRQLALANECVDKGLDPPPKGSSWVELLGALVEGFERGWIGYAVMRKRDGEPEVTWRETPLGEREIAAFRRRSKSGK